MSTFGVMKARIAQEMKRGELTASATAVQASVLSAIEFFKRRRFHFNEFNDALLTASASATYVTLSRLATDSGIRPIIFDSIKAVIGTRDYPLTARNWREIDSVDAGQWYGYPEWYAIHSEKIRLYPPPNQAYVLRISGVKDLIEVTAGAAAGVTNAWTNDAEEMIRCKAKSTLFRDELRNMQMAGIFESEAERVYKELLKEVTAKTSAGRIRPTNW